MPAYVIADVKSATDEQRLQEYRRRNTPTVEAHGGRFIVRGGASEVLEGGWDTLRIVIMEFPDMDAARAWYASPEYQAIAPLRQSASETRIIAVEGV
jgi:uncharacterized protein (DUF1330 family)